MTQDAPCHQGGPRVNGIAEPTSASVSDVPRSLLRICDELRRKVTAFLDEQTDSKVLQGVQSQVRVSMGVIEEAMRRYGPEELALSYNGGKDCIVLLVLILACFPLWPSLSTCSDSNETTSSEPRPLQGVYIVSRHPFPEVEDFVASSAIEYHIDLARYALPMRPALEAYLGEKKSVKAIFVGTRRTDPHGKFLTHFDPTDKDWPQFIRVHPVIDWHYAEIWAFIRHLDIPFCSLYNQGFTSLGGITDTHPNPALALDASGVNFRPAYELMGDDEERLGRDS